MSQLPLEVWEGFQEGILELQKTADLMLKLLKRTKKQRYGLESVNSTAGRYVLIGFFWT